MIKKLLTITILGLAFLLTSSHQVLAGTDLVVTCSGQDTCTVSPIGTPLFDETAAQDALLAPGHTRSQVLTVTNENDTDTCNINMVVNDVSPVQATNLAERMFIAIDDGVTTLFGGLSSGVATNAKTHQNLFDQGSLGLGTLLPNSTEAFVWTATFDPTSGNEYQGLDTVFDFNVAFSCIGPDGTPPPGNPGGGNPGGGNGPASPQVCTEQSPASAPANLVITNQGINTVTLSWEPVNPVTHYALVFTRDDGAQYGSNNIGNVTSYTITNLSGGSDYTFEIFGVNGCAPGPRSSVSTTGGVGGGLVTGNPVGQDNQVLGVTEEALTADTEGEVAGTIAGIQTTCAAWKFYLPWILLIVQAGFIMVSEYYFKSDKGLTKHYLTIGITVATIAIFYLLRACDCYQAYYWLALLCKWYWVVALVIWSLLRVISYAFLEEVDEQNNTRRLTRKS